MPTAHVQPETTLRPSLLQRAGPIHVFLIVAVGLFTLRLALLIHTYAVNIFFSDQWEFNDASLFEKHSIWQMFSWQHTWHRPGLAAVFDWLVEPLFHWDSKIECYVFLGVLFLTTVLALELQRRLQQRLRVWDIVIPAILLSPAQYESLLVTPNFAQGAFPLLFLVLIGLAWLQKKLWLRYALLLIVAFLATYSGFGLFAGILLPFFIAIDHFAGRRTSDLAPKPPRASAYALLSVAISLLTLGFYFANYRIDADIECFTPHLVSIATYSRFASLIFAHYLRLRHISPAAIVLGLCMMAMLVFVCVRLLLELYVQRQRPQMQAERAAMLVPLFLILLTLMVCLNTAYGRACGGLGLALAPRYTTYVEPAMLGLYFYISGPGGRFKKGLLAATALLLVGVNIPEDRGTMAYFHDGKQRWKSCYLQARSVDACNALTQFQIFTHPPERARLQEKLLYLEQERLNLFYVAKDR